MLPAKQNETGTRPGFLIVVTSTVVLLIGALWYLKTRQERPVETIAETAVAETPPPAPVSKRALPTAPPAPRPVAETLNAPVKAEVVTTLEDGWGIQVSSMRLSMANSIVDLRYKVLNPEKAARLGDGKTAAYIIDRATGKKLNMPAPPKEGAFPPTSHKLVAGKMYFAMVSNQGGTLKSGSQVTVVVGGSEATNLTVE